MVRERGSKHWQLVQLELMGGLLSATSLGEAAPYLLSAIGRALDWNVGTLWEVNEEANALRAVLVWHPPELPVPEFESETRAARFARGEGLPGRVWNTGAPIWVEDVTRDTSSSAPRGAREGFHSALLFPVGTHREVHGIVEFFSRHAQPEDPELAQTLAKLGRQIGQHLERMRAEQALQGVNEGLERRVVERTQSLRASEVNEEQAVRALASSEQRLRALAGHLQTVQEKERAALAREIHDVLGQELTGLKMDAAWVLRRVKQRNDGTLAPSSERLESMLKQIDTTIATVRQIATNLRPAVLDDLGLVPALEWQAREFQVRSDITTELSLPDEELVIDEERAAAVFRIFQELLTNVARHASARKVQGRLATDGQSLVLEISDDGRGIREDDLQRSSSLGLIGIRERALMFGGELTISGASGRGTSARVRIPLGPPLPRIE